MVHKKKKRKDVETDQAVLKKQFEEQRARRAKKGIKEPTTTKRRAEFEKKKKQPEKKPDVIRLKKPEKKKGVEDFVKGLVTGDIAKKAAEERGGKLATGVVGITGIGALAGTAGGIARITQTASQLGRFGKSLTTQRSFVGKSATSGVDKIFHTVRPVATRFATNSKSIGLTKSSLLKRGLSGAGVAFIAGAFGSYPFAAWAKQEVLGAVKINTRDAIQAGDFELAEEMIAMREEIAQNSWWRDLPYKNVVEEFVLYFKADKISIELDKRLIENARGEREFEETGFEKRRREADEEATETRRQTQLEERSRDAKYFALIREGKFEEAQELLDLELKGGAE